MPKKGSEFGLYDNDGNFRAYASYAGAASDFDGLENWRIRPADALRLRPLRDGDLIFFHATRQFANLDKAELVMKSEEGEFLPGFYTTSGTDLNGSLKLGWYWYECKKKVSAPKTDWHVLAFVLRKAHFEAYLAGPSLRDTCRYYLQEPTRFAEGGGAANAKDVSAIEFANTNGQIMVFPDKATKVRCGRGTTRCSLDEFVDDRKASDEMANYAVIVGLQKPPPLDMRQQCWASPNGLWHINHAERYVMFDRKKGSLDAIAGFVATNNQLRRGGVRCQEGPTPGYPLLA